MRSIQVISSTATPLFDAGRALCSLKQFHKNVANPQQSLKTKIQSYSTDPSCSGMLKENSMSHDQPFYSGVAPDPTIIKIPTTVSTDNTDERILGDSWKHLYSQVQSCENFVRYRERQKKEHGDRVWPEHLEKAFFQAIVKYPPMGRAKQLHRDKQHGRNMLISDFIFQTTGELRNRKQVSSHIQQIKPFFKDYPAIMKYFNVKDHPSQGSGWRSQSITDSTSASTPSHGNDHANNTVLSKKSIPLEANASTLKIFRPNKFDMFLQRKSVGPSGIEEVERLHTYTHSAQRPLDQDLKIQSHQELEASYPILAQLNARGGLNCEVVAVEATLALPVHSDHALQTPSSSVELGISYHCISDHPTAPAMRIRCRNTFFMNKAYIDCNYNGTETDHLLRPCKGEESAETWLGFGSRFWAIQLELVNRELRVTHPSSGNIDEEAQSRVSQINVVQEIFNVENQSVIKIMVLHWSFRLSKGTQGNTSWRRLVTPPQSDLRSKHVYSASGSTSIQNGMRGAADDLDNSKPRHMLSLPYDHQSYSSSASAPVDLLPQTSHRHFAAEESLYGSIPSQPSHDIHMTDGYDPFFGFDAFGSPSMDFSSHRNNLAPNHDAEVMRYAWLPGVHARFTESRLCEPRKVFREIRPSDSNPDYEVFFGQVYSP